MPRAPAESPAGASSFSRRLGIYPAGRPALSNNHHGYRAAGCCPARPDTPRSGTIGVCTFSLPRNGHVQGVRVADGTATTSEEEPEMLTLLVNSGRAIARKLLYNAAE